jgi:hypothetical protein
MKINIEMKQSANFRKRNNIKQFFFIVLFSCLITSGFSQESSFYLETEVDNASSVTSEDGSITVNCLNSSPDYLFLLYDKEPVANANAISQSERIADTKYVFTNLKPGVYFICVYDGKDNCVCHKVVVSSN